MNAPSTDRVGELRECPFCGAAAEIVTYGSGKISRASVRCSDKACGAHLRLGLPGESLIAAWNTRHESEALTATREALETVRRFFELEVTRGETIAAVDEALTRIGSTA